MEVIIRKMVIDDIDQVMEVEKNSFTTPWSKEAFSMEITKNILARYLVAELEGKIVGYGGLWLIIDEGHITNIAVDKKYRNRGIGSLILEGLINICREWNTKAMTLEVRKSNEEAKNLYKKYGFIEYGIRPGYYADDKEDAIIMWKKIES